MGAEQAFQWAVSHPEFMDAIVATSGTAKCYGHGFVRLEGQIALTELAQRLDNPRLVVDPPLYRESPLLRGPSEVDALDLEPPARLFVRVAGRERAIAPRLERALAIAAGDGAPAGTGAARSRDVLAASAAQEHWRARRELAWVPAGSSLIKVPLQPGRIVELDAAVAAPAIYTAGGQQALVAWPAERSIDDLDRRLVELGLSGLVVRGPRDRRRLGLRRAEAAVERARRALDPHQRFLDP